MSANWFPAACAIFTSYVGIEIVMIRMAKILHVCVCSSLCINIEARYDDWHISISSPVWMTWLSNTVRSLIPWYLDDRHTHRLTCLRCEKSGVLYSWKLNPVQGPHNISLMRLCCPECVLEHQFKNHGSLSYLCFSYEFSLRSSAGSSWVGLINQYNILNLRFLSDVSTDR